MIKCLATWLLITATGVAAELDYRKMAELAAGHDLALRVL